MIHRYAPPPHPQFNTTPTQSFDAPPKIQVKDLSFGYPNSKQSVLSGISFTINPGQQLGIFGPTGSEKQPWLT